MTDSIIVRTNLPDFRAQLKAVGVRMERLIIASGLRAAGRVFRDEARRRAPVLKTRTRDRTAGALRSAIRVARSRASRKDAPVFTVGVRASKAQTRRGIDPFYWRFLEGGWIARGPGRKFKGGVRSKALQRRRALVGGARRYQYPFLAPTFTAAGPLALRKFNEAVAAGIEKENARSLAL